MISEISAIGCVPISLFACITDTSTVRSFNAFFNFWVSITPSGHGISTTSTPLEIARARPSPGSSEASSALLPPTGSAPSSLNRAVWRMTHALSPRYDLGELKSSHIAGRLVWRERFVTRTAPAVQDFASVAEPVKTMSRNPAPILLAIVSRALSAAAIASCPNEWSELGFPNCFERYGSIARRTAGSMGVVAA